MRILQDVFSAFDHKNQSVGIVGLRLKEVSIAASK